MKFNLLTFMKLLTIISFSMLFAMLFIAQSGQATEITLIPSGGVNDDLQIKLRAATPP